MEIFSLTSCPTLRSWDWQSDYWRPAGLKHNPTFSLTKRNQNSAIQDISFDIVYSLTCSQSITKFKWPSNDILMRGVSETPLETAWCQLGSGFKSFRFSNFYSFSSFTRCAEPRASDLNIVRCLTNSARRGGGSVSIIFRQYFNLLLFQQLFSKHEHF